MNKKAKFTFRGMNQDVTKSKHPFEFYYEGKNIRIITTGSQSTASLSNEKGNSLVIDLPSPCIEILNNSVDNPSGIISYNNEELQFNSYELIKQREFNIGNCQEDIGIDECSLKQKIIGYTVTRNSIILFTTDDNGFDCIWEINNILNDNYELKLLYVRNLGFSTNNPIQALYNYENDIIQKIYWVDGKNQLRFLNIRHSIENGDLEELIDIDSSSLDIAGDYDLSQPIIEEVSQSGEHTAGMIQYSYNLYKLNGNQTVISPFSNLEALDKGQSLGGGEVNENVGASPLVKINSLDDKYTHIKLYAIKYTSFNQIPEVSIIVDQEIDNYEEFQYLDTGNKIETIPLDNFLFLGSNPFIPQHIESKDNRLFACNVKDKAYLLDLDMRAYSFGSQGLNPNGTNEDCEIISNEQIGNNGLPLPNATGPNVIHPYYNIPKHDSINPNYDVYKYQSDGSTFGGEGKFIKYELATDNTLDNSKNRFFKNDEIYRLGIQFYNKLGQKSFPFWIADFKALGGNLLGDYNYLKVELKPEFYTHIESLCLPEDEQPVGYKIIRADRQLKDRTIICQGNLTGMMVQTTNDVGNDNRWIDGDALGESEERRLESLERPKLPLMMNRSFQLNSDPIYNGKIAKYNHLRMLNEVIQGGDGNLEEIFRSGPDAGKRQQSWQYLKMMQLYSPEVLFNNVSSLNSNLKLKVTGTYVKDVTIMEARRYNTLDETETDRTTSNIFNQDFTRGFYGTANDDRRAQKSIYNRYKNYAKSNYNDNYVIYRTPEVTERGQGNTSYSGDDQFRYINSLDNLLSDRFVSDSDGDNEAITTANAFGTKCVTLVLGSDGVNEADRKSLIDLYQDTGRNLEDLLLIGELRKDENFKYIGNIYGGNSIEAKSRTSYIEIGDYKNINEDSTSIESPGDTFVHNFNFGRILKTDTEKLGVNVMQLNEFLEYPIETTVDLNNRNDMSLQGWDNKFQPRYEEYHKYNRVYSQQPNLIQNTDISFKFKKVDSFDTRVIASKQKIPGEIIDSYTDFLENEIRDLDGKYGAINGIVNFNDELYTLQDEAVAKLIINPTAQVQSNDGLSLELGTGGILYDHQYLTTTSGSVNKWSIVKSPSGFYYLDTFNKAWRKLSSGQGILNITDMNGFYSYFQNNLNYNDLSVNNPIIKVGAVGGFNFSDGNSYLTIFNENNSFTLNFNERSNSLESFWDFKPSWYINKGKKMFTTHPDNNKLYEHGIGNYGEYYDTKYPSYVTLMINPEADLECVFNNIEYKSEIYLDDIDQPTQTLSHITAWNEYQQSNRIPLELGRNKNLRRKFRNWRALIPREAGSRNRIRNPWVFLKLELDTENNYKFILHDIIVHYTT